MRAVQLVYEILLRFVMNGETDSGTMRRYVNLEFIDKLVLLLVRQPAF